MQDLFHAEAPNEIDRNERQRFDPTALNRLAVVGLDPSSRRKNGHARA
jgi:hypothetical protein